MTHPSVIDRGEQSDWSMGAIRSIRDQVVVTKRKHDDIARLELYRLTTCFQTDPGMASNHGVKYPGGHHPRFNSEGCAQSGA